MLHLGLKKFEFKSIIRQISMYINYAMFKAFIILRIVINCARSYHKISSS
jgi:hypothetical protein